LHFRNLSMLYRRLRIKSEMTEETNRN
jgi:hypothetical protein